MKWFFGMLAIIQAVNSYAYTHLDVRLEKCTKDQIIIEQVIANKSDESLFIYELAMPWSSGDFGVHYNIFYKQSGAYVKIRQDYFTQNSMEIIDLKNKKIKKSIDISRFFGGIHETRVNKELFVYWTYYLINQDSSYKKKFDGFFIIPQNCDQ
ncbi:hypothetical protein M2375_001475 [Comamonas sp. BIGb0152]|uniref:hypothetical protein n=1 Tax=Comamonas sp. BIGb0152 TaxID=2940601 RepID=UPI002168FB0C|nr:hypothetical protein [Comamonas sp. BIGb0152]MCS4293258.1 hypothetical protein [Comamonas sp. BIGb0152]